MNGSWTVVGHGSVGPQSGILFDKLPNATSQRAIEVVDVGAFVGDNLLVLDLVGLPVLEGGHL